MQVVSKSGRVISGAFLSPSVGRVERASLPGWLLDTLDGDIEGVKAAAYQCSDRLNIRLLSERLDGVLEDVE